jgi:hypothetical protein
VKGGVAALPCGVPADALGKAIVYIDQAEVPPRDIDLTVEGADHRFEKRCFVEETTLLGSPPF